eukprot:5813401-Prorocentrum_lima.AAC.1
MEGSGESLQRRTQQEEWRWVADENGAQNRWLVQRRGGVGHGGWQHRISRTQMTTTTGLRYP